MRAVVCGLIESDALVSLALYGSVYGLVVITFERFVKIVHPVAHRNHYRRWMTYVGVATPWLIGLLTSFVPALTTAHFVDGTCRIQVCSKTHEVRVCFSVSYTLCLKKVPTFELSVTLSNLIRFSKILHCWKAYEIWYKTRTTLPTSL